MDESGTMATSPAKMMIESPLARRPARPSSGASTRAAGSSRLLRTDDDKASPLLYIRRGDGLYASLCGSRLLPPGTDFAGQVCRQPLIVAPRLLHLRVERERAFVRA